MKSAKAQVEKPLDEKEVLQKASDVIVDEGIPVEITVANPNILHRLKILKTSRTYILKPLHYGTLIRISKILHDIGEVENVENYIAEGIESLHKHANKMINVIALALTDSKTKPTFMLKYYIKWNLTTVELFQLLHIVVKQMRITEYLQSIILVKGMNQMTQIQDKMGTAPQNTETAGELSVKQ